MENVLEKILEEIKEAFDENIDDIEDSAGIHHFAIDSFTAWYIARKIIRSHMDEIRTLKKKPVWEMDVMHHESYDLGRNVGWNECLETMQRNTNNSWIPVEERLPEVGKMVKVTVHSSEWIGDYYSYWVPEEEKTYHPEERNVYDGYIDRVGMWKFCDDGGSVYACDKEFGTDKEIVYDVVTAWMPKEQIEPYKEK
jgi:hypothetical protein|nr:MAG TPA: Protein of unknown function (DUF551) [Caudoviricetes sp.]